MLAFVWVSRQVDKCVCGVRIVEYACVKKKKKIRLYNFSICRATSTRQIQLDEKGRKRGRERTKRKSIKKKQSKRFSSPTLVSPKLWVGLSCSGGYFFHFCLGRGAGLVWSGRCFCY